VPSSKSASRRSRGGKAAQKELNHEPGVMARQDRATH
jgi:hypothetical protein